MTSHDSANGNATCTKINWVSHRVMGNTTKAFIAEMPSVVSNFRIIPQNYLFTCKLFLNIQSSCVLKVFFKKENMISPYLFNFTISAFVCLHLSFYACIIYIIIRTVVLFIWKLLECFFIVRRLWNSYFLFN